jgi:hypothetical protein
MNNILTLFKKDWYELSNHWKKIAGLIALDAVLMILGLTTGFRQLSFLDSSRFAMLFFVLISCFTYGETTVYQVLHDVRNGVYEKYFINKELKNLEIVFAKIMINCCLSLFQAVLLFVIVSSAKYCAFEITSFILSISDIFLVICISIGCTCLGFLSTLLTRSEENGVIYSINVMIFVFVLYAAMSSLLHLDELKIIFVYLLLDFVLIFATVHVMKSSRFIKNV